MPDHDPEQEEVLDEAYKLGISSGLGNAAEFLMYKATEKFELGKDEEARMLRSLANDLKKQSKDAHPNKKGKKKK